MRRSLQNFLLFSFFMGITFLSPFAAYTTLFLAHEHVLHWVPQPPNVVSQYGLLGATRDNNLTVSYYYETNAAIPEIIHYYEKEAAVWGWELRQYQAGALTCIEIVQAVNHYILQIPPRTAGMLTVAVLFPDTAASCTW